MLAPAGHVNEPASLRSTSPAPSLSTNPSLVSGRLDDQAPLSLDTLSWTTPATRTRTNPAETSPFPFPLDFPRHLHPPMNRQRTPPTHLNLRPHLCLRPRLRRAPDRMLGMPTSTSYTPKLVRPRQSSFGMAREGPLWSSVLAPQKNRTRFLRYRSSGTSTLGGS